MLIVKQSFLKFSLLIPLVYFSIKKGKLQNNSRMGLKGSDRHSLSVGGASVVGVATAAGAGRGFNLGVVLTEACCHCDTLPLFSQ